MTLYEVLGVATDATDSEIRQAFKGLARRHHPDRNASGSPVERAHSEAAMRSINNAWSVLSVPERRSAYDESIDLRSTSARAFVRKLNVDGFVPFDDGFTGADDDLDDDDSWRFEPDVGDPRSAPSRQTTLVPFGLCVVALSAVFAWLILDVAALGVAALVVSVVAAVSFFMLPIVAMAKAADSERS